MYWLFIILEPRKIRPNVNDLKNIIQIKKHLKRGFMNVAINQKLLFPILSVEKIRVVKWGNDSLGIIETEIRVFTQPGKECFRDLFLYQQT